MRISSINRWFCSLNVNGMLGLLVGLLRCWESIGQQRHGLKHPFIFAPIEEKQGIRKDCDRQYSSMGYRKDNVNVPRKGSRCNVADQPRTVCIESWGRAGRTDDRPEGRRGRISKPLLAGERGYEWTGEEESDTDGLIIEGGRSIWSRRGVLRELRLANQRRQITPALCANHSLLTPN